MSMKKLTLITVSLLALTNCGKSGGSGGGADAMDEFMKVKTSTFTGGAALPNGDYVKYVINANNKTLTAEVEIRQAGVCTKSTGSLNVELIGGIDQDGQSYRLPQMLVQVNPKHERDLESNKQFLHLIADKPIKAPCSGAPKSMIADVARDTHLFTDFGLNKNQLAMASPAELHGSSTCVIYEQALDLGIAYDSATGALKGVDIPKHQLETDYLFGVNRKLLRTDNIPNATILPLALTDEDVKVLDRAQEILSQLKAVHEISHAPKEEQNIINSVWYQFFNK